MKYSFKYKRVAFGRMEIVCVEIPQIHTEQLDPSPVKIVQEAYDALNMYISIAILTGEAMPLPNKKNKEKGLFQVDVSPTNEQNILNQAKS